MRVFPVFTWVLLAAACGKDTTELAATARVEGSFVVVEASCPGATDVHVEPFDARGHCSLDNPAILRIPAAQLGAGAKKLVVKGVMVNHDPIAIELAVDVPDAATGPYLVIEKCERTSGTNHGLHVELGDSRVIDCDTYGGARAKLVGKASPNAKLVIGGKTIEVPASGELATIVDFSEGILALTIDELVDREMSDGPRIKLPWKLEARGKAITGTLAFRASFGGHRRIVGAWLRDLVDGKIDRPKFVERAGRKTVVRVPTGDFNEIVASDRRGTVREVALVAVDRETKRTKDGTCDFNASGGVTRATRYGVELELKVMATLDGKVVATKTFASSGGCPSFAMLDPKNPEVAVTVSSDTIKAWLDELGG